MLKQSRPIGLPIKCGAHSLPILKHSTIQAAKLSIDLIQIQELFALSKESKKHHCNYPRAILDLENDPIFSPNGHLNVS